MVLIDACVRLLPGVIGAEGSLSEESFEGGLLEYPHYTKPREWEGRTIPEVLLSGDHKKIAEWRRREAERITAERRPDLAEAALSRGPSAGPAQQPRRQQGDGKDDAPGRGGHAGRPTPIDFPCGCLRPRNASQ